MKPIDVLALTIAGNVAYHLTQKSIAPNAHPIVSMIVTYVVAIAGSLLLFLAFPMRDSTSREIARLNWASIALGLAIVAVEAGFLLVYRSGWNVSVAAVTSNTAVALILLPAGMLLFHERVTPVNLAGVAFCLVGLTLVTRS